MSHKQIIQTFALAMVVYVAAVFLWPTSIEPSVTVAGIDKTARLAGLSEDVAFRQERFGVPAPEQTETRVE
ncbi:MAG TPA: hypothetical protein VGO22_22545 [Pseudorhizobium sp.]|nr:hypothetical protein [Pseudorhizobium sp.]